MGGGEGEGKGEAIGDGGLRETMRAFKRYVPM